MAKHNVWMSVSDLMTGLMIIFLFIAISYMSMVRENQSVLTDYVDTKNKLHDKLVDKFKADTARWQMTIGKDLSMKFNDPTVLFSSGSSELTPEFKDILKEFLPRYFDILLKDSLRDKIQEIRIEGHTDTIPYPDKDPDPYIANVILSQERALNVIRYFRKMPCYKNYSKEEQRLLEYWFTANGLSYGKAIGDDGQPVNLTGKPINDRASRRVEFKIVTTGEQVLENFVNKKDGNISK